MMILKQGHENSTRGKAVGAEVQAPQGIIGSFLLFGSAVFFFNIPLLPTERGGRFTPLLIPAL
jgi:hypothetical protein